MRPTAHVEIWNLIDAHQPTLHKYDRSLVLGGDHPVYVICHGSRRIQAILASMA